MPREVHEHYTVDPENPGAEHVLTGYTMVTRESDWDDRSRERALELAEFEENICPCGCGLPITISRDPKFKKRGFLVHESICYARQSIESYRRAKEAENKDARSGWNDGMHYFATPPDTD